MAMRRGRRRFTRSFAGRKGGRQYWWIRYTPFALTLREAATATHSDILLAPSDYADPIADLNSTQRGGPRLERLICDYGLSVSIDPGWVTPGGSGNIALIPEWMVWKQSEQFVTIVTSSTTFNDARESNRIIMDEVPAGAREFFNVTPGGTNAFTRSVQGRFETRSKVRLADSSLGVAWRGLFDTGDANLNGYTDWFRPTMLISVP